jgi:hypothetical protein
MAHDGPKLGHFMAHDGFDTLRTLSTWNLLLRMVLRMLLIRMLPRAGLWARHVAPHTCCSACCLVRGSAACCPARCVPKCGNMRSPPLATCACCAPRNQQQNQHAQRPVINKVTLKQLTKHHVITKPSLKPSLFLVGLKFRKINHSKPS